jgi:hypothetical protein
VATSKDVVFISHANPDDNEFTRWLSLKLASLGYRVWSDITRLLGGEDFWSDIERAIRENTIKFLYVLSKASNQREGSLMELKMAHDVRKKEQLHDFIIPLHVDDLPYNEINIQLTNLIAVDFSKSWATGLKQLLEKLQKEGVPTDPRFDFDAVRKWWDGEFNVEAGTSPVDEAHYSNWFDVKLPDTVYVHTLMGLFEGEPAFPFPTRFRNGIVTFAPAADLIPYLGTLRVQATVAIPLIEFMNDEDRQRERENRDLVTYFVNEAWKMALAKRLAAYEMSGNRIVFYFDKKSLPDPDVKFEGVRGKTSRRGLMGYKTVTKGKRHWHFAVSGKAAVHPATMVMLRSHVLFSDDGETLWKSAMRMHRARRGQCKSWWNDDWRDRLLATMAWLSNGEPALPLPLGDSVFGGLSARPIQFVSPVALNESARDVVDAGESPQEDEEEDDEDVE